MALNEDDQMEAVFISTRTPVEVDPVSGNEVPPGSLPEEVRDDIPAQLSEGEYVVPADVLRFYGLKFFEDLREVAKLELARMDAEGRIGGEPIEPTKEGELTAEEEAEIEKLTMAVGGYATQQSTQSTMPNPYEQQQMMYRQGAPVAMGNAGYNTGGLEDGTPPPPPQDTQAQLDFSKFGAGFSFSPNAQQNLQQISQLPEEPPFTPVMLYGPNNGKPEVEAKTLEQYNALLAEGYTLTPPVVSSNDDGGGGGSTTTPEPKDPTSWADDLDFTDSDAMKAVVKDYLEVSKGNKKISVMGPLGAAFVGIDRLQGVARSHAIANMVEKFDEDAAAEMREEINEVEKNSMLFKIVPDPLHDGSMITEQLESRFGKTADQILRGQSILKSGVTPKPKPPVITGGGSGGSSGSSGTSTGPGSNASSNQSAAQTALSSSTAAQQTADIIAASDTGGPSGAANQANTIAQAEQIQENLENAAQNPSGTISLKEGGLASKTKKKK